MYEGTGSMVAFYKSQVRTRFQVTLFLMLIKTQCLAHAPLCVEARPFEIYSK